MKPFQPNLHLHSIPLSNLRISTNIRIHSEFYKAPIRFSRLNGLNLVDEVFPETDIRKDPDGQEKATKVKANIHLFKHGAIRLFIERDVDSDWVRSIDLKPSLLLFGEKRHPLTEESILVSLSILKTAVTPLLAEPLDAQHIVPGIVNDGAPFACWGALESEIWIPGIRLPSLHCLSHPVTGPAQGATKTRIQLGNNRDDCVIRFTESKGEASGRGGTHGVHARLILRRHTLVNNFGPFGTTTLVKDIKRLVAFPLYAVARVHQTMMSQLEGTHLPIPPEWTDKNLGKPVTPAKTIALVSQLTSISLTELRAMDEELSHPSGSTIKRLNKDVPIEARRLTPVPVSTLFTPEVSFAPEPGRTKPGADQIDPMIAAAYGQG